MQMRETKNLEFKEKVSNTFLKTVSAYANYGTGKIIFGLTDSGKAVGINDPVATCLKIENTINDAIKPNPKYDLDIDSDKKLVILTVHQGKFPPYFYKSKAYKRNDSSSIEVDPLELSALILKGNNRSYDSLPAPDQDLSFDFLKRTFQRDLGISDLTRDTLITLNLYEQGSGYTIAGELLADQNTFRGIDMVRFGSDINTMRERVIYEKESILREYEESITKYQQYYQYEQVVGAYRQKFELIPEDAFREALANALVHWNWAINAQIKVAMFDDRIEITSPGNLPQGLSKESYLNGEISVLRNPIIANIFFRLKIIEQFGTGIQRILTSYSDSTIQPQFSVSENSVKIILPIIQNEASLTGDLKLVYDSLQSIPLATSDLMQVTGFSRSKLVKLLNELIAQGYAVKSGRGRGTKYCRAQK